MRREVVLPGPHVQPVVLHRGGGGDGVPPRAAEPLHRLPQVGVAGEWPQGVEHVVQARAAQPVQQGAGVLQHDPRLLALAEQLGDELAHPLVAPVEHRGVVVVADVGVLQHPLQVADDGGGAQAWSPGGDERLVHVQGDREGAVDTGDTRRRLILEQWLVAAGGDRRLDCLLRTAQVRQAIDALGQLSHDPLLAGPTLAEAGSPTRSGCGSPSGTVIAAAEALLGQLKRAEFPGARGQPGGRAKTTTAGRTSVVMRSPTAVRPSTPE